MTSPVRILPLVVITAVALLLVSGCGAGRSTLPGQSGLPAIGADPANAPVGAAAGVNVFGLTQRSIHFVMITHGEASGLFWPVVRNGAQAAAAQLGVSVTYEAPDTYNIARMSQLIEAAIATRPAGLVVSLPNPAALAPAVHAAERAGIPVVSINSGADAFKTLGTLLHVGEEEYQAGYAVGQRIAAGHRVGRALCVIHEPHNLGLQQRCRGLGAALRADGGHTTVLNVNVQRPQEAEQLIATALRTGRFEAMLTLDAAMSRPAIQALRSEHLLGRLTYATFDFDPQVLNAIRAGEIAFATDQQPFLQGYLPIVLLTEYRLYGILPDRGKLISTGPFFITKQNAAHVFALVNQGVR
jgi:simple sugar transport system substrate-binding protein